MENIENFRTPFVPEPKAINASYVVPLGGYWTEALFLTNKLGIKLPDESGMSIEDIVQHPDSLALIEVIQSCLKWDPLARADATEIAKMQYFKESITMMDTYFETDTVSMNTALNKLAGIPIHLHENYSHHRNYRKTVMAHVTPLAVFQFSKIQMMDMKTILENILLNSLNEIVLGMKATSFLHSRGC